MKKFTRRHYNKKLVALGLSSFMGIGLTSTGFAAWVISKDASEAPEGNVNVAIITDSSVQIKLNSPATEDTENNKWNLNDDFSFDAAKDDNTGRIRWDGTNSEDLKIEISGKLTGAGVDSYELKARVELPAGITNAISKNYIAWKGGIDYASADQTVSVDDNGNFTLTLEFVWGSAFEGVNPSVYYDTEYPYSEEETSAGVKKGKDVEDATMDTEMETFHNAISEGLQLEGEGHPEKYAGTFKVTLIATPTVG